MIDNEEWRVVEISPNYEVSNLGRVRSVTQVRVSNTRWGVPTQRRYVGRLLLHNLSGKQSYPSVQIYGKNGLNKRIGVHRLVAFAFIPNPEGKEEVNHIDGDYLNPRADNLEWVTHSENMIHATYVLGRNRGQFMAGGVRNL